MIAKLRSWWQKIKAHPVVTVIIIVAGMLGIALLVVLVLGYIFTWGWTGLGPYIPPVKNSNFQRGKTLWDWMQLLIIPIALAIAGLLYNLVRDRTDRRIAHDDRQEAVLQEYVNKMSELLLDKDLNSNSDAMYAVRMRTLAVLSRLDTVRKQSLVQFLYESGFSNTNIGAIVIDLSYANLSQINLSGANLNGIVLIGANLSGSYLLGANLSGSYLLGANLSEANLEGADLSRADLSRADLSEANLEGADLSRAALSEAKVTEEQLKKAKSLEGATMPDGKLRALGDATEPVRRALGGATEPVRRALGDATEPVRKPPALDEATEPDDSTHP